ncbi:MAG: DNRLRE domain-containing protein [Verrucomicrobia bacterium]|nr:DNRLRE domain-containing protein [Verrucomicrobiota bacterium]
MSIWLATPTFASDPAPDELVLSAAQDVLLDNDRPENNMGAANFAAKVASMRHNTFTRIMLVQFDLAAISSSSISRATLRLHCPPSGWDHSTEATFLFYGMLQPWLEGSGVGTIGSETRDGATWNTRDGLTPWVGGSIARVRAPQSPGNFDDLPFATRQHTTYEEWLGEWITVDATELVQQWVAGTRPNYGIAVCALGSPTNNAYTMFATREFNRDGYQTGAVAPQLSIHTRNP